MLSFPLEWPFLELQGDILFILVFSLPKLVLCKNVCVYVCNI